GRAVAVDAAHPPPDRRGPGLVERRPAGRAQRRPPPGAQPADRGPAGLGRLPAGRGRVVPATGRGRRRRDPRHRRRGRAGGGVGQGGFALLAESDLPVLRDLSSPDGRAELLERLDLALRDEVPDPAERKNRVAEAKALLEDTTVYGCRLRAGDDASCLNLYQP